VGVDELTRLVNGYQVSQAIHVAATLGIAEALAQRPRTSAELAAAAGAHEPTLYRVLRALAAVGVFREDGDRSFALAPLGEQLREQGAWAAYIGRPAHWRAWGELLHSVRTGESAFRAAHGAGVWDYRAADPEEGAVFAAAMTAASRTEDRALLDAYDFGRFGTVVDVGGGRGGFLRALLERHPGVRGVLVELPGVAADGPYEIVEGSFFETLPPGGDAYVLKSVLHNWDDEPALDILRACRAVAPLLLVIERELGPPNAAPAAKLSDLNMLVGHGGRERTLGEYRALAAAAGFELARAVESTAGASVIECSARAPA
jgi:hypothetical protein